MNKTILPKKTNFENPVATNDTTKEQLISDPTIPQFGNNNENTFSTNGTTAFNVPQATGFNSDYNAPVSTQYQSNVTNAYPQHNYTAAGDNAGQNAEILVKHSKESSDWINKKWRPAMGWMYMMVCVFDFIIFPIMFTIVQFWETQAANDAFRQWTPITLHGAGLFHMAMGAVLGITAYGRTKEKLEGAAK